MSDNGLQGKVALVTGGGQGIGKAIVMRLIEEGMRVAFLEVDVEAGKQFVKETGLENQVLFIKGDSSRESDAHQGSIRFTKLFSE